MKLIRLMEVMKRGDDTQTELMERPILVNPEGIGLVQQKRITIEDIPIIGKGDIHREIRLITMRNNQTIMVADAFEKIKELCDQVHES